MLLLIVTCKFMNDRVSFWVLVIGNKSVVLAPSLQVAKAVHYFMTLEWVAHLLHSQRHCRNRKNGCTRHRLVLRHLLPSKAL